MKTLSLYLFVIVFCASQLAKAELGLAGLVGVRQNSSVVESAQTSSSSKTGLQYGALLTLPIFPTLSLRTGFLSVDRSVGLSGSIIGVGNLTVNAKQKASYLDLPIQLQMNFPGIDLYLFGGGTYSSLTSYTCEPETPGTVCNSQRKNYDSSFDLGLGYRLHTFTGIYLSAELQYQHGLTNVSAAPSDSQFNRAWVVNLLMGFTI